MRLPTLRNLLLVLVVALVPAAAQDRSFPSDFWHAHSTPFWTDDVPTTESTFGVVDHLNFIFWLEYQRTEVMQPGAYVIRARIKKLNSTAGRFDLKLRAVVDGQNHELIMPATDQTVDTWVWTPQLAFVVTQPNTNVTFKIENFNGTELKQDYWFDKMQILNATTDTTQSLPDAWWHAHGTPFFTDDVPTPESTFGTVDELNFVFWLEYNSPRVILQPGTYVARCRLKRLSGIGAYPLDTRVSLVSQGVPGTLTTTPVSMQPAGEWFHTTGAVFTVNNPNEIVTFGLQNLNTSNVKQDYWFDAFRIDPIDAECSLSLGGAPAPPSVNLQVSSPQTPGQFYIVAFSQTTGDGFSIGNSFVPLDLDAITYFALDPLNPIFTNMTGLLDGNGDSSAPTINVPVGVSGLTLYSAAAVIDPANPSPDLRAVSTVLPITFQ